MARIFKVPFATQGDTEIVPVPVQGDGSVSITQGFGFDYEREYEDPAAKDIPREVMNGLFHDITEAIGDIQLSGTAKWNVDATPYPINALVWHNGAQWLSRVGNNSVEPVAGANWRNLSSVPFGFEQSWQDLAASRSLNVTYTNTEGRLIFLAVSVLVNPNSQADMVVGSNTIARVARTAATTGVDTYAFAAVPVPDGETFRITTAGTVNISRWWEFI